ncbi:uncharacterized protein LOC124354920 [Homalodisca vitripennis]|nr:uncharacterized protein LOC124354920 [Homalodisca vitripennis]
MSEKNVIEIPSHTGGVKPFPIQGRLDRERARLAGSGMTEAERKMRAQWIKDQILSPHEPVHVPEIEKELRNPIRRLYRKPLDMAFKALEPTLGSFTGPLRLLAGKAVIAWFSVYAIIYYVKYNKNDWTRASGWRITASRTTCVPGEVGYPMAPIMRPQDFNTRGFENSPI